MKTVNQTSHTATPQIKLSDISFSPFNYRYGGKPVDDDSLQELAASIKSHEVIQPVTVRPLTDGKYELVIGERRYRASKMAGKKTIPAIIRELTDEQVKEVQVIENLQREDPHPMAEAIGIMQLLSLKEKKVTPEDIAGRIGKSVAYVYQRLKLNNLLEQFREMYFDGAINSSQALKIARLDHGSQTDFYNNHCQDWKEENWEIYNFNNRIRNYQLDLTRAPFNIKDGKLDKKAGACTKCPHNTAVTTSLFPEDSTDARCTNRPCYDKKSRLFAVLNIATVIKDNPELPIAVPDDTALTLYFANDDQLIKGRTVLMEGVDFTYYDELPEKPDRDNYNDWEDEDENETEFADAMDEYGQECQRLEEEAGLGNFTKAILISDDAYGSIIYLHPPKEEGVTTATQSAPVIRDFKAKDYQEAVKAKTLTVELVVSERQRLEAREERSKELDEIKLQESFYTALEAYEAGLSTAHPCGGNDRAVELFVIYDSLGYTWKSKFKEILCPDTEDSLEEDQQLLQFFLSPNAQEVSVLTRMAMLNKSDAKSPNGFAGQMLRLMVEETPGMDTAELVNIQRTATKEREVKLSEKLAILDVQEKKIS